MNAKIFIIKFIFNNRLASLVCFLLLAILCCAVKSIIENNSLLKKYSELEKNIIYHSSIAAQLKLRPASLLDEGNASIQEIESRVAMIFSENDMVFNIYSLEKNSILIKIESSELSKVLDAIFLLSNDRAIIISKVDINFSKESGYIFGEIILLLSQGI
ncbi:membrane protein [Yersinia frederiksenii]|nr:membrane protein [Yersinia frederiksenii]CNI89414.1 membrane protein [Yersinia frederiksenii]